MKNKLPTLGFIGVGAITTAMVTGFCERAADVPYPIVLSPRSADRSAALQAAYPDRVTVAESMQAVVDASDWVILTMLPEAGEEVCRALTFRPEHKIINVMSDKTVEQIAGWLNCKVDTMLHMIPLTFNALLNGPIVQCPPTPAAAEIFGHIGRIVSVESRYHAAVFGAITACEVPLFAVMDTLIDWAQSEGVDPTAATQYVTGFCSAVFQMALSENREGIHTRATVSTPGGMNMTYLEHLQAADGFRPWQEGIAKVMHRLTKDLPR